MTDENARHSHFMKMALDLAEKGRGFTSPNPMVGAVAVKDGEVVGSGWHKKAGLAHAEVNAIDDAKESARGATLYVTLEPCNHTGQTPPCTKKILDAGIAKVVVAANDPNPGVRGGGNEFLRSKGIEVVTGVLKDESETLNEVFNKNILTGRPFVLVKCAATLDGRIATRTGDAGWISNEASHEYVHQLRHSLDGIMVGANTVKNDDPSLTTRLETIEGKDPARIILDTNLSISENAKVLCHKSEAPTILVCGKDAPDDKRKQLEDMGAEILECPTVEGRINLDALMNRLNDFKITGLLIEGGSQVIGSAIRAGIVDKFMIFYAPKILGADDGVPICAGKGPDLMNQALKLSKISTRRFGDDIMISGYF